MSGIEKIIEQIESDSNNRVDEIISSAEEEAREIISKAENSANESCQTIKAEYEQKCSSAIERAESQGNLIKRRAILKEKQRIITETIDKAHNRLLNMKDEEYFSMILKMIEKYSYNENGEIFFNKKDLDRMPLLFTTKISKASNKKLKLNNKPVDIDGGFILVYGGIEENCSFNAIFNDNSEMLQDKVYNTLFM